MPDIEGDLGLDNGSEDDEQKTGILDKILGGYRVGGSSGDSTPSPQPPMAAAENPPADSAPPPPATDSTPSNGVASRMMPSKAPAPVTQNKDDVPPTSFDPAPPKIDMPPMDSTAGLAGMNKYQAPIVPPPPPAADITNLQQQQAKFGTPTNPGATDPNTGKPLYKMGLGTRILGTIGNAATGFATRGQGPVTYVGPGATNARYATAERLREENLANVGTQIKTREEQAEENRKAYEAATQGGYRMEYGMSRQALGNAAEENAATKAALVESQNQLRQAQAGLADAKAGKLGDAPIPKTEAEMALALSGAQQRGDKAKVQLYSGAMQELAKQKAAGKDTSAADLAKYLQVSEFRMRQAEQLDNKERDAVAASTKEFEKKYGPSGTLPDRTKAADPAQAGALQAERDAATAQIHADFEKKRADMQASADKLAGLTKTGKAQATPANNPPNTPIQPSAKAPLPGQRGAPTKANPQPAGGRITMIEKATGKRGTVPANQVDAALATGKYTKVQ